MLLAPICPENCIFSIYIIISIFSVDLHKLLITVNKLQLKYVSRFCSDICNIENEMSYILTVLSKLVLLYYGKI